MANTNEEDVMAEKYYSAFRDYLLYGIGGPKTPVFYGKPLVGMIREQQEACERAMAALNKYQL